MKKKLLVVMVFMMVLSPSLNLDAATRSSGARMSSSRSMSSSKPKSSTTRSMTKKSTSSTKSSSKKSTTTNKKSSTTSKKSTLKSNETKVKDSKGNEKTVKKNKVTKIDGKKTYVNNYGRTYPTARRDVVYHNSGMGYFEFLFWYNILGNNDNYCEDTEGNVVTCESLQNEKEETGDVDQAEVLDTNEEG